MSGSECAAVRRSGRTRTLVDRYDDAAEADRKRALVERHQPSAYGRSFFAAISRAQKSLPRDFSLPKSWIDECLQVPTYRHLKQNLYRSPLSRPEFDEDTDALVCNCKASGGKCDRSCVNRATFVECVPGLCPCHNGRFDERNRPLCDNMVIYNQSFPRTEVMSTSGRGHGLLVCEDVPEHTIVAEYMGEVITNDEMLTRMRCYAGHDNFYFANLGGGLYLDASKMGSLARFANHSCEPNCAMQRWTVQGEPRIVLTSIKIIPAGGEITYCYNMEDDGWANNPVRAQICLCGSKFCSGKVGKAAVGSEYAMQKLQTKIDEFVSGERQGTVEAWEVAIESVLGATAQASPELIASALALRQLVEEVTAWIKCYKQVMTSRAMLDVDEVKQLLNTIPRGWRSDYRKILKQLLSAHHAAREAVGVLEERHRESGHVHWDDYGETLRIVLAAAPLRVPSVDWLLGLLLEAMRWCRRHAMPLVASLKAVSCKLGDTADISRNAVYAQATRLARVYGLAGASGLEWPADVLTVAADFLDERLTDFMQIHGAEGELSKRSGTRGNAPVPLCFCLVLEGSGDCPYCVQCVACQDWFHMDCMNLPAGFGAAIRKSDRFHCPVCLLSKGLLSNFALRPDSEWTHRNMARLARGDTPATEAGSRKPPRHKKNQKRLATKRSSSTPVPDPASRPVVPAEAGVVEPINGVRALLAAEHEGNRFKHFLSPEELGEIASSSRALALTDSPVVALFGMVSKFVRRWGEDVEEWFANQLPQLCTLISSEIPVLPHAAQLLRDLLRLYFRLALLRVRPAPVLSMLRVWIWALAALPALVAPTALVGQADSVDARVDLQDLDNIVTAGEVLARESLIGVRHVVGAMDHQRHLSVIETLVSRTRARRSEVDAVLRSCQHVQDSAAHLLPALRVWATWFLIDRSFPFARVHCWARSRDPAAGVGENQAEAYCWCRLPQQGRNMVCCDRCEEWFHSSCVGLEPHIATPDACLTHSWRMFRSQPAAQPVVRKRKAPPVSADADADQDRAQACASMEPAPGSALEPVGGTGKRSKTASRARVVNLEEMERFFCISCSEAQGEKYSFEW